MGEPRQLEGIMQGCVNVVFTCTTNFLWHQTQILQNKSNSKIEQTQLDFIAVVVEGAGSAHQNFINLLVDACLCPDTSLSFLLISPRHPLSITSPLAYPEQFHTSALQAALPSNYLPSYLGMGKPSHILFLDFPPF